MCAIFTLTPMYVVPVAVRFEIRRTAGGPQAPHERRRGRVEASAAATAAAAADGGSSRRSCLLAADAAAAAHVAKVTRAVLLIVVSSGPHAPPQVEIITRRISAAGIVAHRERGCGKSSCKAKNTNVLNTCLEQQK